MLFNIFMRQTLNDNFGGLHKNMSCAFPLKSDSQLPNKIGAICLIESPFKIIKNVFYFILKALFVLKIFVFVTTFWSYRKNGLIRKMRLISKFMTSQPGSQTIAIHILPNISQSKGNQTMKFGQLTEHNKRNIFSSKSYAENEARRLVPDLFLFFKKA